MDSTLKILMFRLYLLNANRLCRKKSFFNNSLDHSQGNILSDSKIVFPGEERHVPVCERSTYCETVDSYPEHIVNKALERNESIKYLASVDTVSLTQFFSIFTDLLSIF
jgi:hypothetical protein